MGENEPKPWVNNECSALLGKVLHIGFAYTKIKNKGKTETRTLSSSRAA